MQAKRDIQEEAEQNQESIGHYLLGFLMVIIVTLCGCIVCDSIGSHNTDFNNMVWLKQKHTRNSVYTKLTSKIMMTTKRNLPNLVTK